MGSTKKIWWLLLPFLLALGIVIGRASGVPVNQIPMDEPDQAASPAERARTRAMQVTRSFLGELSPPVGPMTLSLSVVSHRQAPGSCTVYPPQGQTWEKEADFVTLIAAKSLFGIPVRKFRLTCGGTAIE